MIVVAGDLLLDVFLLSDLLREEQGHGIAVRPGGSAANTAAWLAHLGCPVAFAGCVGDDLHGRMLAESLRATGVVTRLRTVPDVETGAVAIQVTDEGERLMRSSRGANQALSPDDITALSDLRPRLVHLSGYALLGPYGRELLAAAGELARRCRAGLSFDPSSAGVIRRFGPPCLLRSVRDAGVHILLPNALEAAELTARPSPLEAAAILADLVPTAFVKDGPNGAVYSASGRTARVGTSPLRPMDTTGAGDAFNAGVLAGLYGGLELEAACRHGHRCAAAVLDRYGGRP